ncbi:MAG: UDP-N-acetylglucosamine 1-carboxyvinyltransferase [Planctomycetota bacterium]|nr:UDP-N-acetylglucosamine 1-carboxyvinyltransferase [Planctomycetota bacterium]
MIHGGRQLRGTVRVNGSKNASLPLMAAALLTDQPVTFSGIPALADIANMRRLLGELGCGSTDAGISGEGEPRVTLRCTDESAVSARYDIVRTMRASICVLGPLLARRGMAKVSMPGGCAIGDRPVDLHLRGMQALGAEISLESGDIVARVPKGGRLIGTRIFLGGTFGPTVLGTANVMSAAALARGTTVIESAACEPEIADLADLLNAMGAHIKGAGTPRIVIEGVKELHGAEHRVIPDRIEAGTYIMAAGITNGQVTIENCPIDDLLAAAEHLRAIGVSVEVKGPETLERRTRATVEVRSERRLRPAQITTQPHPGFPTDLQAQVMALLSLADGNSIITERIYPQRFLHVAELGRMGAQIFHQSGTAVVTGVRELIGAPVMASDLRASASLVLAGLAARGKTTVLRVYHLDRGYEKMEERLRGLGAEIERVDDKDLPTNGSSHE